jgi:hypothetical protein
MASRQGGQAAVSEPKRYKVGKIGTTEMIDCVSYDDYARLKAEVERLKACGYHRNFDFSVEHLTRLFKDGKIAEVSYEGERSQWYCADAYARCVNAEIEAKRLKAEVERLTKAIESSSYYFLSVKLGIENARLRKAGDGLIIAYQWLTVEQPDIVRSIKAAFEEWNAAKEGKQS